MVTVGFEVVPLHEKHKQSIKLFVFVHDSQQITRVLLGKDLADNRGGFRVWLSAQLGACAPIERILELVVRDP